MYLNLFNVALTECFDYYLRGDDIDDKDLRLQIGEVRVCAQISRL